MTEEEYSIIMHSRKILLFQNSESWVKKDSNEDFDVPMVCFYVAKICELVGSFILNRLGSVIDKNDRFIVGWQSCNLLRNFKTNDRKREKANCSDLQTMSTSHHHRMQFENC